MFARLLDPIVCLCSLPCLSPHQTPPDMDALLEAWRTAHGDSWDIKVNPGTGYVEMLFGGNVPSATQPASDEEFIVLALLALSDSEALHGIDADTMTFDRVTFLPLAQVGSTDEMAVRFREEVAGVPVRGGFVNVLLGAHGALLAIQSTGLPHLSSFETSATISAADAQVRAVAAFIDQFGATPDRVALPELIVAQATGIGGARVPKLAWQLDVSWIPDDVEPEGRSYTIDAGDGSIIASEPSIHSAFDVSGIVSSNATPGTRPDTASNPPVPQLMPHMEVIGAGGIITETDENGFFIFPGVNVPMAVR